MRNALMTSHEFDLHLDTQPYVATDSKGNPVAYNNKRYHENPLILQQMQDEAEMKAAHDAALKRAGAIEALEAVHLKILRIMWSNPSTSTGLWIAHREIQDQLAAL